MTCDMICDMILIVVCNIKKKGGRIMVILKHIKLFILGASIMLLTACGGSSNIVTEPTTEELAFEKIEAYATSGEVTPSVQEYIDIGVSGVSEDNLADINEVVENLTAEDVDTKEEVQALVDALPEVIPNYSVKGNTPNLGTVDTSGGALGVTLSEDGSKAYVADNDAGLQIIDVTVDILYLPQNFIDDTIELNIYTKGEISIAVDVSANRDDIVVVGAYDTELTYAEYHNQIVHIPISSIVDKTGQTIITIALSNGTKVVTRTLYLNVYP